MLHIDTVAGIPGKGKKIRKKKKKERVRPRVRSEFSINQTLEAEEAETYTVMLTAAHYPPGRSIEDIILWGGVAFAGYLFIFIFTKPLVCQIGAVPNRPEVGDSAGGTSLPWEATFLDY